MSVYFSMLNAAAQPLTQPNGKISNALAQERWLARQQVVATLCLETETIDMKSGQTPQCCKRVLFKQSDANHSSVLRLSEGDILCCILNVYTPFWDEKKSHVLSKVYVYIPNCAYSCWRCLSSSFCPFPPIKALNKVGVTNKYSIWPFV